MLQGYAQGVMCDEEAILEIYFVVWKELRLFFGTTFSKVELMKPKNEYKKLKLHVLLVVLQGIKSSVLSY